jgi:hypothetical protein
LVLCKFIFQKQTDFWCVKAAVLVFCLLGSGCSDSQKINTIAEDDNELTTRLSGRWLFEQDGTIMSDPQTSGLIAVNGKLVSISDGSALPHQRRRLHFVDPSSGVVVEKTQPMGMSGRVRRSCFAQYLSDEPDFEALVIDPSDPTVFITVTEDATRSGALSPKCQQRYNHTGSTAYPTLLVRTVLDQGRLTITHVRPLQYPQSLAVGDFPNDGIEGMAFDQRGNLYLGLEKDAKGQARIFSVAIDVDFWQLSGFVQVEDPQLLLPSFTHGNHPINGMDFLNVNPQHPGILIAVARNDDQLWLIDLAKQKPAQIINLSFEAPTLSVNTTNEDCKAYERMNNTSLEGVAVDKGTIWLINDPWRKNYMKNIQCENNQQRYSALAPLIFSMPIEPEWLSVYQ